MGVPSSLCRQDGLSKESTMVLRLLLVVGIFIYHAGIHMGFYTPDIGHIFVSVFFFLSGYGLELSLYTKPEYMSTSLRKRVLGIMIRYWIVMAVLAVFVSVIHQSWDQFLFEFTAAFGIPHWFITELVVFYVVFYITSAFRDRRVAIAVMTALCLLTMLSLYYQFQDTLYFRSGFCFLFGVLWYRCRGVINRIISGWVPVVLMAVIVPVLLQNTRCIEPLDDFIVTSFFGVVACIATVIMLSVDLRRGWFLHIIMIVASVLVLGETWSEPNVAVAPLIVMVASLSSVLAQIPLASPMFATLGVMSMELYLLHMNIIHYMFPAVSVNPFTASLLAAAATLILGYLLHGLGNHAIRRFNSMIESRCANTVE